MGRWVRPWDSMDGTDPSMIAGTELLWPLLLPRDICFFSPSHKKEERRRKQTAKQSRYKVQYVSRLFVDPR